MPLVLTVERGQASHAVFSLAAAPTPVRVGRSPGCELVVDDAWVADAHAALTWDGRRATVRDLSSASGTWLNGAGVHGEAELHDGDRVQIGQTLFAVSVAPEDVEAEPTPDALTALVASVQKEPRDCARFALRAEAPNLYALVDLAHDPELLEALNESGEAYCAVDETVDADALGDAAPFVVAFSPGSPLLDETMESAWGAGRAVFFVSEAPFHEVYGHVVGLVERDDEGTFLEPHLWEPAALEEVLTTYVDDGAREFFGPIRAFLCEDGDGEATMSRWTPGARGVERERVALRMEG